MKELCPVCGKKLDKKFRTNLSDGAICLMCTSICKNSAFASLEAVKSAWNENHRRFQNFQPNMMITSIMCGFIFVDTLHQWAYFSDTKVPRLEPIIFAFSELESYRIEQVGQKTITKTKGGIARAIVGGVLMGPTGAIVGASTAKTETKSKGGTPILYADLNINGLKTTILLVNPPFETAKTLNSILDS